MNSGWKHFLQSLTGRLLMSAILWSAAALVVGGFSLSVVFHTYVVNDLDQKLERLMDAVVGISEIAPTGEFRFSRPLFDQRFDQPYSGWYWQISEEGHKPVRSRSLWDFEFKPDLDDKNFSFEVIEGAGPDGQRLRIAYRDIILPEADRILHYQVAVDTADMRGAVAEFNRLLIGALSLIMLTVTLALVLQVAYGLRPLRVLGRKLTNVRSGRDQRIEGDWPEDLRPLAQEINALIDQNEKLVDRARTHVGNLAHALKTPLSIIMNEAQGLKDKPAQTIVQQSLSIREHIDHHLKRARIAGGGSGAGVAVRERLDKLIKAVSKMPDMQSITFDVQCPKELMFDGEKEDLDEILGNLLENAGKWSHGRICLTVHRVKDIVRRPMLEISVEDDGPGVPEDQLQKLFERGKRLDERVPGTGLGLAIVRDIVDMYGGDSWLEKSSLGGLSAIIRVPSKH